MRRLADPHRAVRRRARRGRARDRRRAGARPLRRRDRTRPAPPSPFALSGGGNALLGRKVRFRGAVESASPAAASSSSTSTRPRHAWTRQARATVKPDGTFVARWRARRTGQFQLRALVRGEASSAAVASPSCRSPSTAAPSPPGTAPASTATRRRAGSSSPRSSSASPTAASRAGRTSPCATGRGRSSSRSSTAGPFGCEARWDLTAAAAQQLGFTHTDRIGAVRVDRSRSAASR